MYQRREFPEKSWSFSRHKSFIECKRRFYFNTYGHWNGWEYNADERSKKIYRLKKLTNIHLLSGQLLHEEIAQAIKKKEIDQEKALERIRSSLNKAVLDSRTNVEKWEKRPKNYNIFHESYYGDGVKRTDGQKIIKKMKTALANFLNSYTWDILNKEKIEILEVEKEEFPHFMLRDYKIYCILDLFYKKDNKYYIVDWKSGKKRSKEYRRQMEVYALYVLNKYPELEVKNVKGYNEYLSLNEKDCFDFKLQELVELKQTIVESMEQMDQYLLDNEKNKPKDENNYPENTGRHCRFCNFIEVCDKGKKYLSK